MDVFILVYNLFKSEACPLLLSMAVHASSGAAEVVVKKGDLQSHAVLIQILPCRPSTHNTNVQIIMNVFFLK